MIVDGERKTLSIEPRDINFFLTAYVAQYMAIRKGESPDKIVFPMYPTVPHPTIDTEVAIDWIDIFSDEAQSIVFDGSNVEELSEEQKAVLDAKDEEIRALKEELSALESRFYSDTD